MPSGHQEIQLLGYWKEFPQRTIHTTYHDAGNEIISKNPKGAGTSATIDFKRL